MEHSHILIILVKNASGVLSKVTGLFSRRGYNIRSLSVGETTHSDISRITIEVAGDDSVLEQITKQLRKLIDVKKVRSIEPGSGVAKELVLAKVRAGTKDRAGIIELCDIFRAKIVDTGNRSLVIEMAGSPEKNEALLSLLKEYDIIEVSRTGITAVERGAQSIYDD